MAKYPNEIFEPREKEDRAGVVYDPTKKTVIFSKDIKDLDEEVVAIEKELGTNPRGPFNSVKEFLQHLLSKVKDYLNDLLDVEIVNPADGQVLTYEEATQKWKNKPAPAAIDEFIELIDTPNSYSGQAGKTLRVNTAETGLEFAPFPAGDWKVIAYVEVTTNVDYVDFTGLDINTDKFYILFAAVKNPLTSNLRYYIFVEGDYTPTNYYTQYLAGQGTNIPVGRMNDNEFLWIHAGTCGFVNAFITRDPAGRFRMVNLTNKMEPTALEVFIGSVNKNSFSFKYYIN